MGLKSGTIILHTSIPSFPKLNSPKLCYREGAVILACRLLPLTARLLGVFPGVRNPPHSCNRLMGVFKDVYISLGVVTIR